MDLFQMIGTVIIIGFIIYLVYFYYNKKSIENFEIIAGSRSEEKLTQLTQNTEKAPNGVLHNCTTKTLDISMSTCPLFCTINN